MSIRLVKLWVKYLDLIFCGLEGNGKLGNERRVRWVICRKSIGNFSLVKRSKKFEFLWVKLVREQDIYFIGAVYIPPSRSNREFAKDVLLEIEVDILNFRKLGKVILMGDFNCRFGGEESSIVAGNNQFTFSRTTHDMDSKAKDAPIWSPQ